jgi:hypothetical protein
MLSKYPEVTVAGTCIEVEDGKYEFKEKPEQICASSLVGTRVCCKDKNMPKGGYKGQVIEFHSHTEVTIKVDAGEHIDKMVNTGQHVFVVEVATGQEEFQVDLEPDQRFVYRLLESA